MRKLRKTFLVLLVATIGLFVAEFVCHLAAPNDKLAELDRLRSEDPRYYPATTAQIVLMKTKFQGFRGLVPLSGLSNTPTLFCDEEDGFLTYQSDRYGFNNPDSLWDQPKWDVAVLGDSFVQGACVPEAKNALSQLRANYAVVANLGSFGNGPYGNLASLREYAEAYRPKEVLWVYVPNDLAIDLPIEGRSSTLTDYLHTDSVQKLRDRQSEIDAVVQAFLDDQIATEYAKNSYSLRELLTLTSLGKTLRIAIRKHLRQPPPPTALADYEAATPKQLATLAQIVGKANSIVNSWGGRLTFVIFPDSGMLTSPKTPAYLARLKTALKPTGVAIVDLFPTIANAPTPLSLYTALDGRYGHYNQKGYQLVSRQVLQQILSH